MINGQKNSSKSHKCALFFRRALQPESDTFADFANKRQKFAIDAEACLNPSMNNLTPIRKKSTSRTARTTH